MSLSPTPAPRAPMVRCACTRCGRIRVGLRTLCPACGAEVDESNLEMAWLLSTHHLSEAQLVAASERVASGDTIRPTPEMVLLARRAMGRTFREDAGFTAKELGVLCAVGLVLTPLPGWLLAYWWRASRPRAAVQAFFIAGCCSALYAGAVLWVLFA